MKIRKSKIFLLFTILFLSVVCQNEDEVTIHPQDEDEDKDNFVAPSEEVATSNTTIISHEELDDEGFKNATQPEVITFNTTAATVDVKPLVTVNTINPRAQVILPIRRRDTAHAVLNLAPCGGVPKQKANTLTNMGSKVQVIWETIVPVAGGNCTVKLSPGMDREANFTTLTPVDISLNKDYSFPCGRVKGIESHQFKLPIDYVCDQCTLQWTWMTPEGNFYSCSDIIINGNKIEDCIAKCQNGGACFNGKCLCADEFYGDFCENSTNESSGFGWVILVVILILVISGAVYYFFFLKNGKTFLDPFKKPLPEKPFVESQRNPLQLS